MPENTTFSRDYQPPATARKIPSPAQTSEYKRAADQLKATALRVLNERADPKADKRLTRILRGLADKAEEGDVPAAALLFDRAFGKVAQKYEGKTEHQLTAGGAFAKLLEQMNRKQPGDDAKLIEAENNG